MKPRRGITFRGERRRLAKKHKLLWRHLDRTGGRNVGQVRVHLPNWVWEREGV